MQTTTSKAQKNPPSWTQIHTDIVRQVKRTVKEIPCLHLADPFAFKIVETDASNLGYGGILKQVSNGQECIVQFTSAHWNDCQKNYSIIKKEILSIVLCISKF